jgi:lipid-binding SYLF domain-containing protein
MRQNPDFRGFDYFAARARGILIFPQTIKAAFLVGGEGGKGVLLARNADGSWSPPAFYGIGSGSVGLQVGYQKATIVLFLMNERTLMSVIDRGLTLGADASVAAGTVGDTGRSINATTSSDVVQLVDAGGLFAGVSLNGAVISARTRANHLYYGPGATTTGIVIDRLYEHPASRTLRDALVGR